MTTADFIAKTYNTTSTRERRCSSVLTDYEGVVYSYGYHYPLAFNIKGLDCINTQGYSSSTAKHISWAWRAVGYNAISVKLWRAEAQVIASDYSTPEAKLIAVKTALQRQLDSITSEMSTKKRQDTQVYKMLDDERARVTDYIREVEEVL